MEREGRGRMGEEIPSDSKRFAGKMITWDAN